MKKGLSNEIIARIELFESTNIVNALEKRYFIELMSYRKLSKLWKVNERTIARIIIYCQKQPRYGGDAVKTQWINNDDRRDNAAIMLANINHNLALKGLHVRQGKTKENSELIRGVVEKLKTSSSFFRPEVRKIAIANSKKTRLEHPENNWYLKSPVGAIEGLMIDFLNAKNIKFKFRHIVKGYFINFYLLDYNLLIDLQGSNRFPLSFQRHQAIQAEGFRIVYCSHDFIKKAQFADLYNYISGSDKFSFDPSISSKESMIWGARNLFPFGKECNQVSVERTFMNTFYKLHIATSSN